MFIDSSPITGSCSATLTNSELFTHEAISPPDHTRLEMLLDPVLTKPHPLPSPVTSAKAALHFEPASCGLIMEKEEVIRDEMVGHENMGENEEQLNQCNVQMSPVVLTLDCFFQRFQ